MSAIEQGYKGVLVSMGGVISKPGLGRKIEGTQFVTTVALTTYLILPANSQRISAIIQNLTSDTVALLLDDSAGANPIVLQPYGVFQIDNNFPWTGNVHAYSTVAGSINILEVSVQ